jgi:hypothetical protein
MRVANGIPLGSSPVFAIFPVRIVNSVQILKQQLGLLLALTMASITNTERCLPTLKVTARPSTTRMEVIFVGTTLSSSATGTDSNVGSNSTSSRGGLGLVRVFGRNLHSRMPSDPTHVRLKLLHARDQWHSSRKFTRLTGLHCKLYPNTEGTGGIVAVCISVFLMSMLLLALGYLREVG